MDSLLLEIGTEEIPAGYINPALEALAANLLKKLTAARIEHGEAKVYGTPRKLAVKVGNVAGRQKSITSEIIGPPTKIGLDQNGNPTVAAHKFAQKVNLDVNKLSVKETDKGSYLCVEKAEKGQPTRNMLKSILPEAIFSIPFPKKMRWADLDIEFARPIFSILALLGKSVIPFQLGNLKSGRYTHGHYFLAPGKIKILDADDYVEALRSAHVLVDIHERRQKLVEDINKMARRLGGRILPDEELVDINTHLVEYPIAVAGNFDREFLEVPDAVLINAMREHQKYFSVIDPDGKLMPNLIAVNNTAARDMALVTTGHERVIRARLADAQFFYRGDLEISNDQRVEKLKSVLFQAQLGTMYQKTERIGKIAEYLVQAIVDSPGFENAGNDLKSRLTRAARLCKADLVSQVVGEFPKLQGIIGKVYATLSGELPDVAAAIEEHYQPVYSGAPLPQTLTGAILGIADKIDSICGCFSVGLVPTGASDPYALRRQGIGIVQIMNDKGFSFSLKELIGQSLTLFKPKNTDELNDLTQKVYTFIKNRLAHLLAEENHAKDIIAAIVDVSIDHVPNVWKRIRALEAMHSRPDFEALVAGFKRVGNMIKKSDEKVVASDIKAVDRNLFEHQSESILLAAYKEVEQKVIDAMDQGLFDQALVDIASLRVAVDGFFDGVMVLAEDKKVRRNRLALLVCINTLFGKIADFSKLST